MPTYRITGVIVERHDIDTTIEADSLAEAKRIAKEELSHGDLISEAETGESDWEEGSLSVELEDGDEEENDAFEDEDEQDEDE